MRRTALLVGGWLLATSVALAVGLLGVRAVSDSVTSPRPASLSPASVRAALARTGATRPADAGDSESVGSESSSSSTAAGSTASSSTSEPPRSGRGDSESSSSASSAFPPSSSSSEGSGDGDGDGGGGGGGAPATTEDRTYDLIGGSVGVRFENGQAHLLWATPKPGYTTESSGSSSNVDVRFEQVDGSHESRLRAYWNNGPQQEIEEKD